MDRKNVINEIVEHIESALAIDSDYVDCVRTDLLQYALALLKEQPEVVRCKDCKYYDHFNGCMSWHDVNSNNDNWYCADGERKE